MLLSGIDMKPFSLKSVLEMLARGGFPEWTGKKAWRAHTDLMTPASSAAQIIRYEQGVLGNDLGIPKWIRRLMESQPSQRLQWLTKTKKAASRYGQPEPLKLPRGSRILATDGDEGYLVFFGGPEK